MQLSRAKRRTLLGIGVVVLAVVLIIVALPVWLPWVFGGYQRYERKGYSRFVVHGFGYTNSETAFRAGRIEALVPTVWLWNLWNGRTQQPYVRVEAWELQTGREEGQPNEAMQERGGPGRAPDASGVSHEAHNIGQILTILRRWLPNAVALNGKLQIDRTPIEVRQANWAAGRLRADVIEPRSKESGVVEVDTTGAPRIRFLTDLRWASCCSERASDHEHHRPARPGQRLLVEQPGRVASAVWTGGDAAANGDRHRH